MDKVIKLYKGDGDKPSFPNRDEQIITSDFTYSAKRMGGAPTITCSIYYPSPLDNVFDESVYTEFNGEKFYLHRRPSATKGNRDVRYKYDLEFVSERIILDSVYFIDVVDDSTYLGISNSTKFTFSGDIYEFVKRMNYSLQYAKVGYSVVIDDGVESDTHNMSFDDQVFSQVLQEVYNTYEIPYYFKGKKIHIGTAPDDALLSTDLEYGSDKSLLSITKQSANNKVINRITGMGSSDNLPYYYPNETPQGKVRIVPKSNGLIDSYKLVDSKLLSERAEVNSRVEFTLLGGSGLKAPITTVDYEYYDPQGTDYIKSAFSVIGDYSDTHEARLIYPYDKNPETKFQEKEPPVEGRCSYRYRVRLTGELESNSGGIIRWLWEALPNSDIYKEIEQGGRIDFGFFDNLVVYEGGHDYAKTIITPKVIGTYPSIYIDTPFVGSERKNNANEFLSRAFDITMEFTFWKHNIYGKTDPYDVCKMNFRSVSFRSNDIQAFVWKGSRYYSKNISDFGVSLSQQDLDNIQELPDRYIGEHFTLERESYITPSQNLMPPIYREEAGAERFYNALNDRYPLPADTTHYYHFVNPYIEGHPKEYIENFDDIKPTIVGMKNEEEQPYNQFLALAYDNNDNDEVDETTEKLLHPYFFAKLPKYNGKGAFNLFDHASEAGPMRISMTSGNCGACTFEIAVDKNSQKNTVQVDSNGNLLRDEQGRVVFGVPQEEQNDTINNSVWIALYKDVSTFPSTMPNEGERNKPSTSDTFVILNILLPEGYIRDAEKRLEEALIAYMHDNNDYKWNFSVHLSRIYLAEHEEDVLPHLNENSSVNLVYQGVSRTLYVSSFTYKMNSKDILPEISIELADTLTINQNPLDAVVSTIKTDILSTIASINIARQGTPYFLRKDIDDKANGLITFEQGLKSKGDADFGDFVSDTKGTGIYQDASGNWHIETDYIKARKKLSAKSVEIEDAHHIGGQQVLTAASANIDYVVKHENYYRCYFLKHDASGKSIVNKWKPNDQAYCRVMNLDDNTTLEDRFYWRRVITTSNEEPEDNFTIDTDNGTLITLNYHYIDLSVTDCAQNSDVPRINDNVVQLGYQGTDDTSRQNAIILAGAGEGSPYIRQYIGINSFKLPEPDTQIKPNDNILSGKTKFKTYDKETGEETGESTLGEIGQNQNLEVGVNNLLRNSGFTGDYETADLTEGTSLKDAFATFSPSLEHWEHTLATAQESEFSQSGKEVYIESYGGISQTILHNVRVGEDYIFSFYGKGGQILVSFGGELITLEMTEEWKRYSKKVRPIDEDNIFTIRANDNATLCDIMLEKGNVLSEWTLSPLDNRSELAKYETLTYLQNILKADTEIDGGVISTGVVNTGLINMGHYDEDGKISKVTAGISGTYNNDDSVAFFGGGDLAKAIYTVQKYKENPNYEPTTEELASMAKAVITHGGRAILQDIILRGYVYAEGGVFRGTVYAKEGVFNGGININRGNIGPLYTASNIVSSRYTKDGLTHENAIFVEEGISTRTIDDNDKLDISCSFGHTTHGVARELYDANGNKVFETEIHKFASGLKVEVKCDKLDPYSYMAACCIDASGSGAYEHYAILCNNGMFAGLRTRTKIIGQRETEAPGDAQWYELDATVFSVMVAYTSGTCYITLPAPQNGQELVIDTLGANLYIQSKNGLNNIVMRGKSDQAYRNFVDIKQVRLKFYATANEDGGVWLATALASN